MFDEYLRPKSNTPIYPPYHKGYYIEEFFYDWWHKNNVFTDREYIDIFWTNIYCNNGVPRSHQFIQDYLNNLDPNKKYFTVCQHDDAPIEELPKNTLVFSAGGNRIGKNIIPIPLICSPLSDIHLEHKKNIFCSFVGSDTHIIRKMLYNLYLNDKLIKINLDQWRYNVSNENFEKFQKILSNSLFSLCPRGYGASSFRLYESIQMGSVPVYISDYHHLPWADELNWKDFCIIVKPEQIKNLKNILLSYFEKGVDPMIKYGEEIYQDYFTMSGVCNQIVKRL